MRWFKGSMFLRTSGAKLVEGVADLGAEGFRLEDAGAEIG